MRGREKNVPLLCYYVVCCMFICDWNNNHILQRRFNVANKCTRDYFAAVLPPSTGPFLHRFIPFWHVPNEMKLFHIYVSHRIIVLRLLSPFISVIANRSICASDSWQVWRLYPIHITLFLCVHVVANCIVIIDSRFHHTYSYVKCLHRFLFPFYQMRPIA